VTPKFREKNFGGHGLKPRRVIRNLRQLWSDIEEFYRKTRLTDGLIGLRNGIQAALVISPASSLQTAILDDLSKSNSGDQRNIMNRTRVKQCDFDRVAALPLPIHETFGGNAIVSGQLAWGLDVYFFEPGLL